jgi:hypothetical protein
VLPPLRLIVAVAAVLALTLPPLAAGQEGPPPDDLPAPPPATTAPVDPVEPAEPAGPTTLTITVPPLPAQKPAPKKATPAQAKPAPKRAAPTRREPVRRETPRSSQPVERFSEPETSAEPAAEPARRKPAAKKAKPKPRKQLQRVTPRVVAKATPPIVPVRRPIRDQERVGAVLAVQFTLGQDDSGRNTASVVLALVLAGIVGAVAAVAGLAPVLAERWPALFVPVMESTGRIVVTGVCLGGALLVLAMTWALTGPGG